MSGSDPSVNRSGRSVSATGTGGADDDGCPKNFETVLGSPDPSLVAVLTEGELLDIVSIDLPARGVVATTLSGEIVGAITRDILRLRKCLADGVEYEAEVLRIAGGSVTVDVRQR